MVNRVQKFIDDYINLNYDYLIHKSNELKPISIDDEFLNLNYWINKVRNNEHVDESQMINVNCDDLFFTNLVRRNKLISRKNRYKSKLIFRIYQLFGLIKKIKNTSHSAYKTKLISLLNKMNIMDFFL